MMRTPVRLAVASVAAASLALTAAEATAEPPGSAPAPAPTAGEPAGTGSSALDSGSAAAQTAVYYIQTGNAIGFLALLAATPLQIMTTTICDMATTSGLPSPCPKPR